MQKTTFLIIAGIAAAGAVFFECSDTYSSEAVRTAELGQENTQKKPEAEKVRDSIYLGFEKGTIILKK